MASFLSSVFEKLDFNKVSPGRHFVPAAPPRRPPARVDVRNCDACVWRYAQATLSGAMDVIAVRHEDGTIKSTPFHVRFGIGKVPEAAHSLTICTRIAFPASAVAVRVPVCSRDPPDSCVVVSPSPPGVQAPREARVPHRQQQTH